jgi:phosphohistidine phosphatase SixA
VNLYLVRHANAGARHEWDGRDGERPLSKKGWAQSEAIAEVLGRRPIRRLLSSPAVRCLQTVGPLAHRLGLEIEPVPELAEGAALPRGRELIDGLIATGDDVVLCGHGDLIPELIEAFAQEGAHLDGAGCAKGSIWHLVAEGGRVVKGGYHRRPAEV